MNPLIEKWQKEVDRLKELISQSARLNSDPEQRVQLMVRCNVYLECIADMKRQAAQAKHAT